MKRIAVIIGALDFGIQAETLKGVFDYTENAGAEVFVFSCDSQSYGSYEYWSGEYEIFSLPEWDWYDGVIFLPNSIRNPEVSANIFESLKFYGGRLIVIDDEHEGLCCYTADNAEMMRTMTRHVLDVHHTVSVVYIGGPLSNAEAVLRRQGFLSCMKKYGLEENKDYFMYEGDYWIYSAEDITEKFISENGGAPEAIICANDYMAIGAIEVLKKRDIAVPGECLVTGFDNSSDAIHYIPSISSIGKPFREMGRSAAEAVLDEDRELVSCVFDGVPIYSESCGCSVSEALDVREFGFEMQKTVFWAAKDTGLQDHLLMGLLACESGAEYLEILKKFIADTNPDYFSFCLCTPAVEDDAGKLLEAPMEDIGDTYTDIVQPVLFYSAGQFTHADAITRGQLIPFAERDGSILSVIKSAPLYIVEPVHFMEKNFGYIVVGTRTSDIDHSLVHRLARLLGNAMMVLKRR